MTTAEPNIQRAAPLRINRRVLGVFAVRVLGIFALFAFEVSVASSLGVAGYGAFSFLLATSVLVARFAALGWLNALTRRMTIYLNFDQLGLCKGSIITAYATTAIGLSLIAALLALISKNFEFLSGTQTFTIVMPLGAALAVIELNRFALRGLDAGDIGELFPFLVLPALAAAIFWVLSVQDSGNALQIYTVVAWSLVAFSAASVLRRLPAGFWGVKPEFRLREWTFSALAMLVGSVSTELSARMAVLVLGSLGNEHDAGLFQAAARLALMTVFFLRVLTPVAAPRISVLYHAGKQEELRHFYFRNCALAFAGALPFALLFWTAPEIVLNLFGSEFHDAAPILRILAVGYLISATAGPCGTSLLMIGKERIYSGLTTVSALATGVACYVLAGMYGGIGAAIATAGGIVLINAMCFIVLYRAISAPLPPADTNGGA